MEGLQLVTELCRHTERRFAAELASRVPISWAGERIPARVWSTAGSTRWDASAILAMAHTRLDPAPGPVVRTVRHRGHQDGVATTRSDESIGKDDVPSLLMIVPSRGRPSNLDKLVEAWRSTSTGHADLVVALDDDDPALYQYNARRVAMVTVGPRQSFVAWTNEVAVGHASDYRFIGSMGDDHRPRTVGWDRMICEALEDLGTGVVYGDDLGPSPVLPSAVALTSDIVAGLGYLIPPVLEHNGADAFWLELARALGRSRFLPEVVLEHLHYSAGKSSIDHIYLEGAERLDSDRERYEAFLREQLHCDVGRLRAKLRPAAVAPRAPERPPVRLLGARS